MNAIRINRFVFPFLILLFLNIAAKSQNDWSTFIGKKSYVVINYLPDYNYIPDGHLSVLPDSNGQYVMYWSEYRNSRTTGDTQFPESQKTLQPDTTIFGGRMGNEGPSNGVNDGGSWLMSVHRHNGDTLIGFYHGESHWYPRNGDFTAWKSLCVAYSYDNGYTWADSGQIITSHRPKPEAREWGGAGDCCVVWDSTNNRWNCYFQEHNIRMAVSYDPMGAPGTWKKYYNGSFEEEGLGGFSSALNNLTQVGGANPSVHWNTFYNEWVMTYHGWNGGIYITRSQDGISWDYPDQIIKKGNYNNWYPTIIGETDTKAGQLARLYYGEFYTSSGWRFLVGHDILFDTTYYDYGNVNLPWEASNIGAYNFAGKAGIKNNVFTITGTSNSQNGENDAMFYTYRYVGSDGEISSRLTYQTDYNNKAYSGLMARENLEAGSKFVSIAGKSSSDTIQIKYRTDDGAAADEEFFQTDAPWFKLRLADSVFEFLSSEDGINWNLLQSIAIDFPDEFYTGFYNTSHGEANFCTAKFDDVIFNFDDVGISNPTVDQIMVFPNPAKDFLNIRFNNGYQNLNYKIIGLDGKIQKTGAFVSDEGRINLKTLPGGQQYILQLFDNSSLVFENKFVKQ
jgi:hypothetical protein